jgi:hypothetical protein
MTELDWGKPMLFMFSDDDPLCDPIKLEELIKEKIKRGQKLRAIKFDSPSEHCGHFKKHTGQYAHILRSFLNGLDTRLLTSAKL